MPERAFASMVFPLPGGHCIRILCPPAAAMRSARFACACPWILEKSTVMCVRGTSVISRLGTGERDFSHDNISTASPSLDTLMTSISGMTDASSTFACGRNIRFIPISRASMVAGSAHCILLMAPSSASSPRKRDVESISSSKSHSFPRIPSAIGRS